MAVQKETPHSTNSKVYEDLVTRALAEPGVWFSDKTSPSKNPRSGLGWALLRQIATVRVQKGKLYLMIHKQDDR